MITFERLPMTDSTRFPIKFDAGYALLSSTLLIPPSDSYIEITAGRVAVRMSWAFRAKFDVSNVTGASPLGRRIRLTRGVHGLGGRWLVNGSGDGILVVDLEPKQRGYVMGVPVSLRQLQVSVDDPRTVAAALGA
jgi:hypothetical protein